LAKAETQTRRDSIAQQISADGAVTVDELAERYRVSEVSIRKDLADLESKGLCIRRFGGAVASAQLVVPQPAQDNPAKRAIAAAAAQCIRPDTRIIIDSGRTTSYLLPHLGAIHNLKVMTNSLATALKLTELDNELTLLMPGGTWDKQTESFQGQLAEQMLRFYDFDQLFIGADGIDLSRGTTTFNELISLSRVMAEVSKQVIVMAESWKLGRKMPNQELAWKNINVLVTDAALPQEQKHVIENFGIKVVLAESEN
jgi:DeoR/GlpR family transcriptional regulator of sugar metabolism